MARVGLVYLTKFLTLQPLHFVCSGAILWFLYSLFWLDEYLELVILFILTKYFTFVPTVGLCCDYYSRRHLGSWRGNEKECWGSGSWILSLESLLVWLFLDLWVFLFKCFPYCIVIFLWLSFLICGLLILYYLIKMVYALVS